MQILTKITTLAGVMLCSFATALAQPVKVTIEGGDTARHATPVTASLSVDLKAGPVTLKSGDQSLPAQVEKSSDGVILRWIEPSLEMHQSKTYEIAPLIDSETFQFVNGDGYTDLNFGKQPIYRYMTKFDPADYLNTYKPFWHIFGLHGDGFITKGPGGMETHHRGLFFGFMTDKGNFWACRDGETQRFRQYKTDREFTGPVAARAASVTDWMSKDNTTIARDVREVTAWRIAPDVTVMDFDINFEAVGGDLKLQGNPHHGGFHFRAAEEVQGTDANGKPSLHAGNATYIRPASAKSLKDDNYADTPWAACLFTIKGNPYVVVHMDHPDNPRPTTFSMRPYGRFGPYFNGTLKPGEPKNLHYRIVVMDGKTNPDMNEQKLASMYQDFVAPPKVTLAGK